MFYPSNVFHVVLHKRRFEDFILKLNQNITILEFSMEYHIYVHQLISIKENIQNFSTFQITVAKNAKYMHSNFIFGGKEHHDMVCNASFEVLSLQTITLNIILKNLRYLHDIFELKLSKLFYEKLFNQSEVYFSIPDYNEISTYNKVTNKVTFSRSDIIFTKDFLTY